MSNRSSKAEVLIRERQAVALRMQGKTFIEIAEALGYAGSTPESAAGTAHTAVMRALRRDISEDAKVVRVEDLARLEALLTALWPFALHDIKLALSYHWEGQGKDKHEVPNYCYEKPTEDDKSHVHGTDGNGAHICYVMPSEAMLKSQEKALKILERRSRYLGLDHADGVADRIADIMKENARTLGEYVKGVLDKLDLNEEQREQAKILMLEDFRKEVG